MWVPPHRLCAHPGSAPYCVIAWSSYTRVLVPHGYMRGRMTAPTGCRRHGERRVSARAQLCRAPGVVTVRACGLMPLGEDGPDGHPLEADPRLPQHCTQSLVLRPAAPQSSTGTCPHVARRDGPPRAAQ